VAGGGAMKRTPCRQPSTVAVDIPGPQRDMLDALAVIGARYSSIWLLSSADSLMGMRILPQGAGHGPALQPRQLALDIEIADLAELEERA
jgi:hypothetical protein